MKKLMLIMGVFALLVVACNKDEGGNSEPFSELTVEQNKQVIETAGIQMVNTMDDMKDLDAIEVAVNLARALDSADPTASQPGKKSKLAYTTEAIAGIADDDFEFNNFFNDLKYGVEVDEPESIQDLWEQIVGTYTWNEQLQDWDYMANSTEVVLLFPALDNSTTNDGKVRIYGYKGVIMENPLGEDYTGDLPTDIALDISVNNTVVINYVFGAAYNDDGIPTALATDLSIPPFTWEVDVTNTDTDVTMNYKFKNGNTVVMEVGGGAKGLFTQANIDANTEQTPHGYWDYQYNPNTGDWEEVWVEHIDEEIEFEEILNSAEAHFQMFNILLRGDINVKALVDQIRIIDESETDTWDEDVVDEVNKYVNLRVLNADNNSKIGDIEAYVVTKTNDWGDSWTEMNFRFLFSDGSTIDAETYFNEGFDNFVSEINSFIVDLNNQYDDIDIDTIDYPIDF